MIDAGLKRLNVVDLASLFCFHQCFGRHPCCPTQSAHCVHLHLKPARVLVGLLTVAVLPASGTRRCLVLSALRCRDGNSRREPATTSRLPLLRPGMSEVVDAQHQVKCPDPSLFLARVPLPPPSGLAHPQRSLHALSVGPRHLLHRP